MATSSRMILDRKINMEILLAMFYDSLSQEDKKNKMILVFSYNINLGGNFISTPDTLIYEGAVSAFFILVDRDPFSDQSDE